MFVGMSGGVDSSVAAALLVERGYDVTGVYLEKLVRKIFLECIVRGRKMLLSVPSVVAVGLVIDFRVFDFQKEYKQNVVDYMIREYQAGRTPNPDIMCNQEVKFKIFLEASLAAGADYIATGHYAGCCPRLRQ
ncbi:hypothetical protein [Candidatus Minimicrobia naudis]